MMFNRKLQHLRLYLVRRKRRLALLVLLTAVAVVHLAWMSAKVTSDALLPPRVTKDLSHFRRSRSLKHYLDNIQLLIEPSSLPCGSLEAVPVVALVTSAPHHAAHREAVRSTWAKHLPTYFFVGLAGGGVDEKLVDNYMEAKLHGDLVVFDLRDHYQNLTLKTALMLQWALDRCPQVEFVFKTDDDVLVNPWTLRTVLKENRHAKLLGYKLCSAAHRDEHNKWYLPRWLLPEDVVPEYLSGTGYLINGAYLRPILEAALRVPLINIEDIYFTYLVARRRLRLELTDDRRLSCYKPLLPAGCAYWALASLHSLAPGEMAGAWPKIESLAARGGAVCTSRVDSLLSNEMFLY